jgi:hypothetical protein
MATGLASWSKTAASNANADSGVNMAEGMAPSAVNDGVRGVMASAAKFRDDISGGITTGGSSTAFTATTNQVFGSLAALDKMLLCIIPHTTSGAAPTLAVDGLAAKAINASSGVAVATGALVAGTPYLMTYVNASTEFILTQQLGTLSTAQITALTATQADQETGTSTVLFVSPGRQHFHLKHPKAWCNFAGTGTPAVTVGSGVTSITDNGTGDYSVNWTTAFSTANYGVVVTVGAPTAGTSLISCQDRSAGGVFSAPAAASFQMCVFAYSGGGATDSPRVNISAFGDLA